MQLPGRIHFKRDVTQTERRSGGVIGGLPVRDSRRDNKKTYGVADGAFIGFMDNGTPVRIKNDKFGRMSRNPDRIWCRLDSDFKSLNKARLLNGPSDNRSYCGYDVESSRVVLGWFALTKALNGRYPLWANQFDIWEPQVPKNIEGYYHALCFAFGLAENRCLVTRFEANNPIAGAPDVFVDNPLSPINPHAFWTTILNGQVKKSHGVAFELVRSITELYEIWHRTYCKGKTIEAFELEDEPYFKYFDYAPFLTPNSGLIQIEKYATERNLSEIVHSFDVIKEQTKEVTGEIRRVLVEDARYFE